MEKQEELVAAVKAELVEEMKADIGQINTLLEKNRTGLEDRFSRIEKALDAKEIKVKMAAWSSAGTKAEGYRPISQEEKAFSSYLRRGEQRMDQQEAKILRLADDPRAGYLAPDLFAAEIIKGVVEFSPVRQLARVMPTTREAIEVPKRTGVFAARHVSEISAADQTETEGLTYGLERIPTSEMIALIFLSNWQLEDAAFNMEKEIAAEMAEQFGVREGTDFISGPGVSGIAEGMLTNTAIEAIPSGSADNILADSLLTLVHSLKESYRRSASWLMNSQTILKVRLLKDEYGRFLWADSLSMEQPSRLLGYPVREAVDMPAVAAGSFPILFGDYRRGYTIADRIDVTVQRLVELRALKGQTGFLGRKRVGGQTVLAEAIKKMVIGTGV